MVINVIQDLNRLPFSYSSSFSKKHEMEEDSDRESEEKLRCHPEEKLLWAFKITGALKSIQHQCV